MPKSLKDLLKTPPDEEELKVVWKELETDSTRGCAVLGAALIDDILRRERFGSNGHL